MRKKIALTLFFAYMLSLFTNVLAESNNYGTNVALNKPVYGTAYDDTTFLLSNATDGNFNTNAALKNGTEDFGKYKGGMVVDLEDIYLINRVIIYTRTDLDAQWARMGNVINAATKLDFSDDIFLGKKQDAGEFKSTLDIKLKEPIKARYIRNTNTVSEIEVYGTLYMENDSKEYTDIEKNSQYNAVKLSQALGVMDGASDNEFGTKHLITREECTKMICKLLGFGEIEDGYNGEFSDVDETNPYAPYIGLGVKSGFISKAEKFNPKNYVTAPELAKMLMCINGYYTRGVPTQNYPESIIFDATKIKLFSGIEQNSNSYITKGDAAIVFYNLLMGKYYDIYGEADCTYMKYYFGLDLMSGIMTNNGISSLTRENSSITDKSVEIDNVSYTNVNKINTDFLGENIYFLKNDDMEVIEIWSNKSQTIKKVVYDYQINSADFNKIYIEYKNEKKANYILENPSYTFYNNTAYNNLSTEDLIPENGYLELIDNDSDNRYEILKVYKPEIVRVDAISIDEANGDISIGGYDGIIRNISGQSNINVVSSNGGKMRANQIAKDNMIFIYQSADNNNSLIEVLNNTVSGKLSEIDQDSIYIDGIEYEQTDYFKRNFTNMTVGMSGQFVCDKNGRVVYMLDHATQLDNEILGVITKIKENKNNEQGYIEIYTEKNAFDNIYFNDTLRVDGIKTDPAEIISEFGVSYFAGKLVILKTNTDNKIISVETEGANAENEILRTSNISLKNAYRGESGYYIGYEMKALKGDNVPVFVVPVDENGKPRRGTEYDIQYSFTKFDSFRSVGSGVGSNDDMKLYGVDETCTPSAVVRRIVLKSESSNHGTISDFYGVNLMAFEKFSICSNGDENCYKLQGVDCRSGKEIQVQFEPNITQAVNTYKIQKENISSVFIGAHLINNQLVEDEYTVPIEQLKKGDILRYGNGKYANASQLELVFECNSGDSDDRVVYAAGDSYDYIHSTAKLQFSTVKSINEGYILFSYKDIEQFIKLSDFSGSIINVNKDCIEAFKASKVGAWIEPGDKIIMYSNTGRNVSIIIYKN